MGGDEYTARMDQQLPEATILLFRRLAHAKVCLLGPANADTTFACNTQPVLGPCDAKDLPVKQSKAQNQLPIVLKHA